jgi:hypothetical protein
MRGVIQKLLAMGIDKIKNIQETKNLLFGRLEGLRIKKRVFGACFSNKSKKRGGERESCKHQHKSSTRIPPHQFLFYLRKKY